MQYVSGIAPEDKPEMKITDFNDNDFLPD